MGAMVPNRDSTRTLVDTLHRCCSPPLPLVRLFEYSNNVTVTLSLINNIIPSHWPPLSHNSRGVPSGQSQLRSRDVFPPPHVAEHSDQHDHGEYSHLGGHASKLNVINLKNETPVHQLSTVILP